MLRHSRAEKYGIAVMHVVTDFRRIGLVVFGACFSAKKCLGARKHAENRHAASVNEHAPFQAVFVTTLRLYRIDGDDAVAILHSANDPMFQQYAGVRLRFKQTKRLQVAIRSALRKFSEQRALCAARH